MSEQNKTVTFVIGTEVDMSAIKGTSSTGKFPAEHSAMKTQISAQLKDNKVTTIIRAAIYATAKYNVNTLVNSLKTKYYGSIEDGKGYVSVTKINDDTVIPDAWKATIDGIKKHYNFKKDGKNLIFIVELRPKQ